MHTHAYLAAGTLESLPAARAYLEGVGVDTTDTYSAPFADMGIDEAREIRERASLRGTGSGRVFCIAAASITTEAQNALLKTFEDPGSATFVLIVPSPDILLPTIRSRMQRISLPAVDVLSPIDVAHFLAASPASRIESLKVLTAADEKDTAGTIAFLAALERALATHGTPSAREGIQAVYRARRYLLDKGALRKALLEQIALLA
jgi:DNA polymerase III gamma/tau subunit